MKNNAIFRFFVMLTILFYCATFAHAGQVITQDQRSWAKKAIQQEKTLEGIKTSNSIAVLYFNNKSGQEKLNRLQKGMAVMLISDLSKVDQIQVVERVRMQALLDEMDLSASGLMDEKTIPKIGQLLGAQYVTSGDILEGKSQAILIDSAVLEVLFETINRQPGATGSLDELFRLEKEILFNILEEMKVSVSPAKQAELEKPMSTSVAALLALFLGIEYSDKSQYLEASKMYEQALVEDPHLDMAKSALQELKGMGLVTVDEVPLNPPVESGGSSIGTYLGIGLLAAAAGGVALALSSSSDNSDNSDTNQSTTNTTAPIGIPSPAAGSTLNCEGGFVTFSFSNSMIQTGAVVSSPKGFVGTQVWSDNNYVVSWSNGSSVCAGLSSVTFSLSGFMDTSEIELAQPREFSYSVTY